MEIRLGLGDEKHERYVLLAGGVAGSKIRKGESVVYLGSCSGLQGKSLEVGL